MSSQIATQISFARNLKPAIISEAKKIFAELESEEGRSKYKKQHPDLVRAFEFFYISIGKSCPRARTVAQLIAIERIPHGRNQPS